MAKSYAIPVSYTMCGIVYVECENDAEFWEKLDKFRDDNSELPLPDDPQFFGGSFRIDGDGDDDHLLGYNDIPARGE